MTSYRIRHRGRVTGPFSEDEIKRMLRRGLITPFHHIARDGNDFQTLDMFPEFCGCSSPSADLSSASQPDRHAQATTATEATPSEASPAAASLSTQPHKLLGVAAAIILFILLLWGATKYVMQKASPIITLEGLRRSVVMIVVLDANGDSAGTGTGFFISRQGHLVTCRHVIESLTPRSRIVAIWDTPEGTDNIQFHPLRLLAVSANPNTDLALLQLSGDLQQSVHPLQLSSSYRVGQEVQAVGFPVPRHVVIATQGTSPFDIVMTRGQVSSLRRTGQEVQFLAIDARVAPGNSGGPVIDTASGKVIGVISRFASGAGGDNINLAIPAHEITRQFSGFLP